MILEIFDKDTRMRIDLIRTFTFVQYTELFCGIGTFELTVPYTEKSLDNLKKRNYILFDDDVLGVIKYRQKSYDTDTTVKIKGYLLNKILSYRVFEKTYKYNGTIIDNARSMVSDLFINPSDEKRKIKYIELSLNYPNDSNKLSTQFTGDSLDTALSDMLGEYSYGYKLKPIINNYDEENPDEANLKTFEFNVIKPVDRTIGNLDGNVPIVFSINLGNLSSTTYEEDETTYNTMAYVAGEGEGENRKVVETGETDTESIDRIELYVDARDLQSETESADSENNGTDSSDTTSGGSSSNTANVDLSDYYTKTEVDELISNIDVDVDLTNYYTKEEVYTKLELDDLLKNIDVDLTGYYTKEEVNDLINSSGANYTFNSWEVIGNGDYYFENAGITWTANGFNYSDATSLTNWRIIVDTDMEYTITTDIYMVKSSGFAVLQLDDEYLINVKTTSSTNYINQKTFTIALTKGLHYLTARVQINSNYSGLRYVINLPEILAES